MKCCTVETVTIPFISFHDPECGHVLRPFNVFWRLVKWWTKQVASQAPTECSWAPGRWLMGSDIFAKLRTLPLTPSLLYSLIVHFFLCKRRKCVMIYTVCDVFLIFLWQSFELCGCRDPVSVDYICWHLAQCVTHGLRILFCGLLVTTSFQCSSVFSESFSLFSAGLFSLLCPLDVLGCIFLSYNFLLTWFMRLQTILASRCLHSPSISPSNPNDFTGLALLDIKVYVCPTLSSKHVL